MTGNGESAGRPGEVHGARYWPAWLFFFFAVLILTFPDALLGAGQFYLRDFHPFFYPQKDFLAQGLGSLSFSSWWPHVGCGVPFLSSLQPGVAYPPSLLLILTGSFDLGLKLFIWFHFLLAFFSAALLSRFLFRAETWAACLGGTAYAFGGFLMSSVSQLNNLQSAAWAPLALLLFLRLVHRPSVAGLLGAAMASALQFLGGGVEVTALTAAAVLLLSLFPVGHGKTSPGRGSWTGPLLAGAALLLALALSAFQLFPTLEMARRSSRAGGGLSDREAGSYSLQPANLKNITVPRCLTDPSQAGYFRAFPPDGVPWLISIYQGVVVVHLALIALLTGARLGTLRMALFFCAALGIFLALGNSFTITAALLAHLPGAGWFRYPEKFLFLTGLTVPLLAVMGCGMLTAHGTERERGGVRLWPWGAEGLALMIPVCFLGLAWWENGRGGAAFAVGIPLFLLAVVVAVRWLARRKLVGRTLATLLIAVLAAADLALAHRPLNALVPADFYHEVPQAARLILEQHHSVGESRSRMPPRCRSTLPGLTGGPPATERAAPSPLDTHLVWRAYLSPNSAGLFGISQVRGSTGMELRFPSHRERLLTTAGLPDKLALLSLWGVNWLVMDRELSGCPDDLLLVSQRLELPGQRLYRLRRALPRLFLVGGDLAGGYAAAEKRMMATGEGMAAYLEGLRAELLLGSSLGEVTGLTSWSPSALSADVTVHRQGMFLAFTEGHDPGWTALVDGVPAMVQEGLGGFTLVSLPGPGRHRIDLRYRPPGLFPGLLISLSVLLALLLWMIVPVLRARYRGGDRPGAARVDRPGGKA